MVKNSKEKIKAEEQMVIEKLLEDSRQSPHEIAEYCGFSRQKVWRIINKLEEKNQIWGYTSVIDDDDIGGNAYFAFGRVNAPLFDFVNQIIKIVKNTKPRRFGVNLLDVYYLNGVYDWIVIFYAPTIREAKRFCNYIKSEYPNHVERIDLMESVFPLIKFGKINPNVERLKEFSNE